MLHGLVLAAAALAAYPELNNTDFYGLDMPGTPKQTAPSAQACAALCEGIPRCVAVTWNSPSSRFHDGNCNFKCSSNSSRTSVGEVSVIVQRGSDTCALPPGTHYPAEWQSRVRTGNLVFAPEPQLGPLPNYGNGYMAMQHNPSGGSLFVAGVFSGDVPPPLGTAQGATSHRAALPAPVFAIAGSVGHETAAMFVPRALALDFERASIEQWGQIDSGQGSGGGMNSSAATVLLRRYMHRERMHLMVADVTLDNTHAPEGSTSVEVTLSVAPQSSVSDDWASWGAVPSPAGLEQNVTCYGGTTAMAETGERAVTVAMCWVAASVTLSAGAGLTARAVLPISVWSSLEADDPVGAAATECARLSPGPIESNTLFVQPVLAADDLWQQHVTAQEALWAHRIEIDGDLDLATTVNSSMYGLLISLREGLNYSTSPGGLPNNGYNGHVFWDVEQFLWPNLNLLHPDLARGAMQYRFDRMAQAEANAAAYTSPAVGLKFPWESAVSGYEACPLAAKQNSVAEIHISGDVALAMWQMWQAYRNENWLRRVAWPVLRGVATFFASRATKTEHGYALLDEGGPDETYSHVNNSAYDLAVGALALRHAIAASKIVGDGAPGQVGGNWSQIATGLLRAVPRDPRAGTRSGGTVREFDGSVAAQRPNGLGVIMLRYPLGFTDADPDFPLADDVHANDLDQYQQWWPGGNAMYWWAFAAGYRDLEGRVMAPGPRRNASAAAAFGSAADMMFAKSTAKNVYGPFKIWAESQGGGGCPNFLSGAGGWLQSVAYGYGGVRYTDGALLLQAPRVPPSRARAMLMRGVGYAGCLLDIHVRNNGTDVGLAAWADGNARCPTLLASVDGADAIPLRTEPVTIGMGSVARVFIGT